MKIKKIDKLKSGKYKLTFEDENKILTYDDVILKNNLLFDKEVDNEKLNLINEDTEYFDVYNKIIRYIYTKMRSEYEVKKFISKYNLSEYKELEIINRLKEIGLINDLKFVKAFISDKINLSNTGPYKISEQLKEHNISEDVIEHEISLIDNSLLNDKIKKIVLKKIKANKKYSNYTLKQKLLLDFMALGYSRVMVEDIIDSHLINGTDILSEAYDALYKKLSLKYSGMDLSKKIKEKLYQKGFDINEINNLINEKNNA